MLIFILVIGELLVGGAHLVNAGGLSISELNIDADLLKKLTPVPTVPAHISRTHRVGAQRYRQFGTRCWHGESCASCVCCGECVDEEFVCNSPPGSTDLCVIYETVSIHTDLEKQRKPASSNSLPSDFPDVRKR